MATRSRLQCWSKRVGLALVLIGAAAGIWHVVASHVLHLDELRRFHAIRPGMTEAEVLAVMRQPPGVYGPAGAKYGRSWWFG